MGILKFLDLDFGFSKFMDLDWIWIGFGLDWIYPKNPNPIKSEEIQVGSKSKTIPTSDGDKS